MGLYCESFQINLKLNWGEIRPLIVMRDRGSEGVKAKINKINTIDLQTSRGKQETNFPQKKERFWGKTWTSKRLLSQKKSTKGYTRVL